MRHRKVSTTFFFLNRSHCFFYHCYPSSSCFLKCQAKHVERQIKEEFESLHQFLREEETFSIAVLKEEEEMKSQMMKKKTEEISKEMQSLTDTIKAIEQDMDGDDVTFLKVKAFGLCILCLYILYTILYH